MRGGKGGSSNAVAAQRVAQRGQQLGDYISTAKHQQNDIERGGAQVGGVALQGAPQQQTTDQATGAQLTALRNAGTISDQQMVSMIYGDKVKPVVVQGPDGQTHYMAPAQAMSSGAAPGVAPGTVKPPQAAQQDNAGAALRQLRAAASAGIRGGFQ